MNGKEERRHRLKASDAAEKRSSAVGVAPSGGNRTATGEVKSEQAVAAQRITDFTQLHVGDRFLLNGTLFTARDRAHLWLLENELPQLHGGIVFHCGPIVMNDEVVSAGPTTSFRLNPYTPALIQKYGIKAIVGKGGMDKGVLEAMRGRCVYFAAVGGAALLYAKRMKVKNVHNLEFGMTEAIWELEMKDFPVIVAMDAHGNSIYERILDQSSEAYRHFFPR